MGITAILGAVLGFFRALPDIIAFMTKLKAMVDAYVDAKDRQAHLKQLSDALKTAHESGDTSGLEKLFNGGAPVPPSVAGK